MIKTFGLKPRFTQNFLPLPLFHILKGSFFCIVIKICQRKQIGLGWRSDNNLNSDNMIEISEKILQKFRHQLWLERITVIEEEKVEKNIYFTIDQDILTPHEMKRLFKIHPFGIVNMYHDGNKKIHICLCAEPG